MSPGGSAADAASATTAPARVEGVSLNDAASASPTASSRLPPVPASPSSSSRPTHSLDLSDDRQKNRAHAAIDMASVTATATMAAAGFDKRPVSAASSSLQTPGSGTFPSELLSPMVGSPGFMKREDALKTPITPPSAYLDFLKSLSPAMSPAPTSTSARFSFNDRSDAGSEVTGTKRPRSPPTSQPILSRNSSYDSNASDQSIDSQSTTTTSNSRKSRPESPRIIIPPSGLPISGPRSSRTPRRLHIPQSPFSPARGSGQTAPSPYSQTPTSAVPWSASFSPRDYNFDANSQPGKVSVRHVVTRTVTYCRTPLEPAPKGKRRKLDVTSDPKASSEEPPLKQEKIEKVQEIKQESATSTV